MAHSHHSAGTSGAHCYDCHVPRTLHNVVGGYEKWTRTHWISSIPKPEATIEHGDGGAPNACNQCRADKDAKWSLGWMRKWWPR